LTFNEQHDVISQNIDIFITYIERILPLIENMKNAVFWVVTTCDRRGSDASEKHIIRVEEYAPEI
jgi:hypothetical protein